MCHSYADVLTCNHLKLIPKFLRLQANCTHHMIQFYRHSRLLVSVVGENDLVSCYIVSVALPMMLGLLAQYAFELLTAYMAAFHVIPVSG